MFNKKTLLFLIILFTISFGLRIYKINSLPLGVHPDEASLGYNAYSILMTGKDEHGISYPLVFKSFGDQKLPGYFYLLVPFIKVFGLNNLGVRLPAVIIGSLIPLLIFFLLRQYKFSISASFVGAFITATNPWEIILSRIWGYESNLGLFFYLIGLVLFFLSINKNKSLSLIFSSAAFGLACYSYTAYQFIVPLTIFCLTLIYFGKNKLVNKKSLLFISIFIVIIAPLLTNYLFGEKLGAIRFNQVGSTPQMGIVMGINESRNYCAENLPKIICYANSNKLISYTTTIISRYIKTFSFNYLFLEGDKSILFISINNYGLFYLIILPFYFIAITYFWNNIITKKTDKKELFILIGFFITTLPALLVEEPQKVRFSALFPFLILFFTYGIVQTYSYLKNFINQKIFYSLIIISMTIFSYFFIINLLFIHIPKYEVEYRTHIFKLMQYLKNQNKNTPVYIKSIDEGITLYAYINKIDPDIFRQSVIRPSPDKVGYTHPTDLGNIHLTTRNIDSIYCQAKSKNQEFLYVVNEDLTKTKEVSKSEKIIYSDNGTYKLMFVYNTKNVIKPVDCQVILAN